MQRVTAMIERTRMLDWWSNQLDEWERVGLAGEPQAAISATDLSDIFGDTELLV